MSRINKITEIINELMTDINDDLNPNLGALPRDLLHHIPSPVPKGKESNEYDNKEIRDFDLDDFASYCADKSNPNSGKFDTKDKLLSHIFVNGFIPDMNKGSNINANKNFNKYRSWKSNMYDIWTFILQMTGLHKNIPSD